MTVTLGICGCYFLPGPQLSARPQSTTTIWSVSIITAEWQTCMSTTAHSRYLAVVGQESNL